MRTAPARSTVAWMPSDPSPGVDHLGASRGRLGAERAMLLEQHGLVSRARELESARGAHDPTADHRRVNAHDTRIPEPTIAIDCPGAPAFWTSHASSSRTPY